MKVQVLKFKINELANKINAPYDLLPQINESNDLAIPYIDIGNEDIFYYVIRERGIEHERTLYRNEEDLLFRIFRDVTFEMAQAYELKNRNNNQDFRIVLFEKQEELMGLLHSNWEAQIKSENDKYLSR